MRPVSIGSHRHYAGTIGRAFNSVSFLSFERARPIRFSEPARRRGRGSALRLAERLPAKANAMKTRPRRVFRGDLRFALSAYQPAYEPAAHTCCREPARRRGKRIFRRRVADGRGVRVFAPTTRIARLSMRFQLRRTSRRSRWLASPGASTSFNGHRLAAAAGSAGGANNRSRRDSDMFCHADRRGPQRGTRVGVADSCSEPVLPGVSLPVSGPKSPS